MRKRLSRNIVTILGIAVILAGLVFYKSQVTRAYSYSAYEEKRLLIEMEREQSGMDILDWDLMRKTKGSRRSGPRFNEALLALDGKTVDVLGFMTPIREFRAATEFMVLPVPLECYFCESPPVNEVLFVRMAQGSKADMINEAVWINGTLTLHKEPGNDFFYSISNAMWGTAERGAKPTWRSVRPEEAAGEHIRQIEEEKLLPAIDESTLTEEDKKFIEEFEAAGKRLPPVNMDPNLELDPISTESTQPDPATEPLPAPSPS